jgi:hypothetical protein
MAALLKFAPTHGVLTAGTIWRMNHSIEGALRRQAQARPALVLRRAHGDPTLVCHWRQGPDGRLSCHWDIDVPGAPIAP